MNDEQKVAMVIGEIKRLVGYLEAAPRYSISGIVSPGSYVIMPNSVVRDWASRMNMLAGLLYGVDPLGASEDKDNES